MAMKSLMCWRERDTNGDVDANNGIEPESQAAALVARILEIQRMTTGQLQREVERLTGLPCRSWNRAYLRKQAVSLVQMGISDPGSPRAPEGDRAGTPFQARPNLAPGPVIPRFRDRRLPSPGSEIVKRYRGHEIRVRVNESDFECFGQRFDTLTAIAKVITGQPFISGPLFFGIAKRKRAK